MCTHIKKNLLTYAINFMLEYDLSKSREAIYGGLEGNHYPTTREGCFLYENNLLNGSFYKNLIKSRGLMASFTLLKSTIHYIQRRTKT
jgi:hypothetical protein